MSLFVGVDGGGTHTRAVVIDGEGRELGRAQGGGSVAREDAAAEVAGTVARTVREAAEAAGVALPANGLWAGLAGAGSAEARAAVTRELEELRLADKVVVGTDAEAAFHDAFGEGPGILLIGGTGSIAWARGPSGEVVRVGGWGERVGDEGSGFAIGMAALRAVARATDGRGPASDLTPRLLARLGLDAADGIVSWITAATKADVASLVPVVAAASEMGDGVAEDILERAVADLSEHVAAGLERGGPWPSPPELVLSGGLLQTGGPLRPRMANAAASLPVRLSARAVDPAMGAARLAAT